MKTIVIAGARSRVGKTSLAFELMALLPGSRYVKIGSSQQKMDGPEYYPIGTTFQYIVEKGDKEQILIIESNSILREITPDVCLYLDDAPAKPSAVMARSKADVISGMRINDSQVKAIAERLNVDKPVVRHMVWLTGARPEPAAAVILIGGKSSRMGIYKSLLPIDGVPAAQRLYSNLVPYFDEVFFSSAEGQSPPVPGVRCVHDTIPDSGPLAGIAAALSASNCRVNFVIACDIPDVDLPLMRKLLSCLEDNEIAVPMLTPDRPETLYGAYDRIVSATAEHLLTEGTRKVLALFPLHRTQFVVALDTAWYANLNTPADVSCYRESDRHTKWQPVWRVIGWDGKHKAD
ncbi:molybdenum cofactor guanylyltransferase [bacterium]|nr:molybdenum cofactor guanylyltransferase [candidate division CSSED10-310 bacterium]